MRDLLYLVWRYLAYNRFKSIILVLSVTLILFLPAGLNILVRQSAHSLTARAETTPLLIGAKGSPLELVLNSLYFESDTPPIISFAESKRVSDTGLAIPIPLYTRFQARGFPIIGTTLDYFDFRDLTLASGRNMAILGECVVGAEVAAQLELAPGGSVVSSPESVFDLAGVYPLKMNVVGVLAPTGTPDDRALFVDLKTSWIIEGLAHGHQDMAKPEAAAGVLKRDGTVVVANASVMQYNEVTVDNMDSFHFHGDPAGFPITAVLAVPDDDKSSALLQGKYLDAEERVQIIQPATVMDELLQTIFTVQRYVVAAVIVIGSSTLMTALLVFMLSLRLRKNEIATLHRIGGARHWVAGLMGAEIVVVLLLGVLLAAALTGLVSQFGEQLIRMLILK
jgi:putative ABC transport system permease protein